MGSRVAAVILFGAIVLPVQGAEPGYAARESGIREHPAAAARVMGQLAKMQKVEVLARRGNWMHVKAASVSGWVRLLDVRFEPPPASALAIARVRPPKDDGIRGFSEEDLLAGAPGFTELEKLKKYAPSAKDADRFAKGAGLSARKLDYLDPMDIMAIDRLPEDFFDE